MDAVIELQAQLRKVADPKKAVILQRFFKTGKGEYGEGDVFLGITVPQSRTIAIKYKNLHFAEITTLLQSKIHEERLIALLILVHNFTHSTPKERKTIFTYYLSHSRYINNWDLVDLSAHQIVGTFLAQKPDKKILKKLTKSQNVWERRIAIIATYAGIRWGNFDETLSVALQLLHDQHDLIQKAVGWMLREVGKRNQAVEETFLRKYYKTMPRTMLRYAIERFPPARIKAYLSGVV